MEIISIADAAGYDPDRFVAEEVLACAQSNVRLIRLSAGQALPAHTHEPSDLMLYAVEGEGTLATPDGPVRFGAGSLAHFDGQDELRIANEGSAGLTLLAFLAPPFPPAT